MFLKNGPSGLFKRTDVKISVLVSCPLILIILLSAYFFSEPSRKAISEEFYEKGKMLSIIGAESIGATLENAVANNLLTKKEVFDSRYIPIEGTSPQRYHTKIDTYIDDACSHLLSAFLKDNNIIYARAIDLNGYVPLKGNENVSKIKSQNSGQDDLAKQILVGKRITRILSNTAEGFYQSYTSEPTNEEIMEFSTPVFVNGEQWGAFCVGFKNATGSGLPFSLTEIVLASVAVLISCGIVFSVVFFFLKPISYLTEVAERVADGDMELPVKIDGSNDIATLADAIERLRVSLKLAMDSMARK